MKFDFDLRDTLLQKKKKYMYLHCCDPRQSMQISEITYIFVHLGVVCRGSEAQLPSERTFKLN